MSKSHLTVNQQGVRLSSYLHMEPIATHTFELFIIPP